MKSRGTVVALLVCALAGAQCGTLVVSRQEPTPTATAPPAIEALQLTAVAASQCTGTDIEARYRGLGLVRLTTVPPAPRSGERFTVSANSPIEAGRYVVEVSDLDEVAVPIGAIDVGRDGVIAASFVLPALQQQYSGNPTGPCLAITLLGTGSGDRWIAPLFRRSDP